MFRKLAWVSLIVCVGLLVAATMQFRAMKQWQRAEQARRDAEWARIQADNPAGIPPAGSQPRIVPLEGVDTLFWLISSAGMLIGISLWLFVLNYMRVRPTVAAADPQPRGP